MALLPIVAVSQPADEYQVKAAFILNFARFTEWPESSAQPGSTFVLGVIADDPFSEVLKEFVAAETIAGQPIEIRRLSNAGDAAEQCHLLFVGSLPERRLAEVLMALHDTNVLTVGDTAEFAQHGGVIALVKEDAKIRFVINVDAANRSDLRLSSKLLSLARVIHDDSNDLRPASP